MNKSKLDLISWVKKYAAEKGGECLTEKASRMEDRVSLKCKCGNIWEPPNQNTKI